MDYILIVTFKFCTDVPCFTEGLEKHPSNRCGINRSVSCAATGFMSYGIELGPVKMRDYI
jgi:hypothetical protein